MNVELVLVSLLPLILFVAADLMKKAMVGVVLSLVASVAVGVWSYVRLGTVDEFILISVAALLIMGAFSLRSKSPVPFKLAPVLGAAVITLILVYFQVFDKPVFVRLSSEMIKLAPAEQADLIMSPPFQEKLADLSLYLIIFIPIHASLVAWCAIKYSSTFWMLSRLMFYPSLFAITILTFLD